MISLLSEFVKEIYFTTVSDVSSESHPNFKRRISQFVMFGVAIDVLLIMAELAAGISPLEDINRYPWLYGFIFLITVMAFAFFGAMVGSREDQLERMALRDPLTGLYNSRYLWTRMDEQWAIGKREKKESSLILFDLDFFKRVNDRYGHPVGDELLKHIGGILQQSARRSDVAARIGGEEFVFFLPNTSVTSAVVIAERIRKTIGQSTLVTEKGYRITVTISAGVASINNYNDTSPKMLYAATDKALYLAKNHGKNQVVSSGCQKKTVVKKVETMA